MSTMSVILLVLSSLMAAICNAEVDSVASTYSVSSYNDPAGNSYTVPLTANYKKATNSSVKYHPSASDLASTSNVSTVYASVAPSSNSEARITNRKTTYSSTLGGGNGPKPVATITAVKPEITSTVAEAADSGASGSAPVATVVDVAQDRDGSAGGHDHGHGHGHGHGHQAPAAQAPVAAATYEAQPVSTGNLYYYYYPVQEYPVEVEKQDDEDSLDPLVLILLPITVIIGLLALASIINTTVINGRSFDGARSFTGRADGDSAGSFQDLESQVNDMLFRYQTALDSEECMDRVVCQMGSVAKDLPAKDLLLSVLEMVIPSSVSSSMDTFREAATQGYEVHDCKRYHCKEDHLISVTSRRRRK